MVLNKIFFTFPVCLVPNVHPHFSKCLSKIFQGSFRNIPDFIKTSSIKFHSSFFSNPRNCLNRHRCKEILLKPRFYICNPHRFHTIGSYLGKSFIFSNSNRTRKVCLIEDYLLQFFCKVKEITIYLFSPRSEERREGK